MANLVNLNAIWADLLTKAPGLFLVLLMLCGLYRLLRTHGASFIASQQKHAESLGAQATAMIALTTSMQNFMNRDNKDLRENIILTKFVLKELATIKREPPGIKKELTAIKLELAALKKEKVK